MDVKRRRCCESDVVGILVFRIGKGQQVEKQHLGACVDVFEAAIAFLESEGSDLYGTYTLTGGKYEPLPNSQA